MCALFAHVYYVRVIGTSVWTENLHGYCNLFLQCRLQRAPRRPAATNVLQRAARVHPPAAVPNFSHSTLAAAVVATTAASAGRVCCLVICLVSLAPAPNLRVTDDRRMRTVVDKI